MSIEHSEDIKNISAALLKFQAEIHGVVRDSANSHFRNKYASLEAVIETARPGLQKVGLTFIQAPSGFANGCVELTTMLIHPESGEWMRSTLPMPLSKQDPQGVGSAITYGLRYALMACLGLPPLDDDGEATRRVDRPAQASAPNHAQQTAGVLAQTMADSLMVSKEQIEELNRLIKKSGADRDRFLLALDIRNLEELYASQFQRAKAMLNKKLSVVQQANGGDDARG